MARPEIDRSEVIADLGALRQDAALRGDDRAAATLLNAIKVLMAADADLTALEGRRAKDRDRHPRNPRKSQNGEESTDFRGNLVFTKESLSVVPETATTTTSRDSTTPRARSTESAEKDDRTETVLDRLRVQAGDAWPEIDRFLCRRPYDKWAAWGDEIQRLTGPGSQFTMADIAAVCRDDEALTRPVESPKGFRQFVLNARIERVSGTASTTKRNAGVLVSKIRSFIVANPGQPPYLPKKQVEALGADVLRAYETVGGADVFLSAKQGDWQFLIPRFEKALGAA